MHHSEQIQYNHTSAESFQFPIMHFPHETELIHSTDLFFLLSRPPVSYDTPPRLCNRSKLLLINYDYIYNLSENLLFFNPSYCQFDCVSGKFLKNYSPPNFEATNHPAANVTSPISSVTTEKALQSVFSKIAIGDAMIRPIIA